MRAMDTLVGGACLLHGLLRGPVVTAIGVLVCRAGPPGWRYLGGVLVLAKAPCCKCWAEGYLGGTLMLAKGTHREYQGAEKLG